MLSGYITTLKNKQKLDVSSEGPSSRVMHLSMLTPRGGGSGKGWGFDQSGGPMGRDLD